MSAWGQTLVSLGAFSLGYLFSFLGEYLRSRSAKEDRQELRTNKQLDRDAERDALRAKLRAKRLARHFENQLNWMVELQDVLSEFMRAFGQIEHADFLALKGSGEQKTRLPLLDEALSERANSLQRRVIVLASRVDSKDVRDRVRDLMNVFGAYGSRAEVTSADISERGSRVIECFPTNIQVIGDNIRRLAEMAES